MEHVPAASKDRVDKMLAFTRLLQQYHHLDLNLQTRKKLTNALLDAVKIHLVGQVPASVMGLELQLRKLVQISAPWEDISGCARSLFEMSREDQIAAYLIELAFLHGSMEQAQQILKYLEQEQALQGFSLVHPAVRMNILIGAKNDSMGQKLCKILNQFSPARKGEAGEVLLRFFHLAANNPALRLSYEFFKTHKMVLFLGVKEVGSKIGVTTSTLFMVIGSIASRLGLKEESIQFFKEISPAHPEYDNALKFIYQEGGYDDVFKKCDLGQKIYGADSDDRRLHILENYFLDFRRSGAEHKAMALDAFCENPLQYISEDSDAWAKLARILIDQYDLRESIPHIFSLFAQNTKIFHAPSLDMALWNELLERGEDGELAYWHGVATVHAYLHLIVDSQEKLWQAMKCVHSAPSMSIKWSQLIDWACHTVRKHQGIPSGKRSEMLICLAIVRMEEHLPLKDIEAYLELVPKPPLLACFDLLKRLRLKDYPPLAKKTLLAINRVAYLRNEDLAYLWQNLASISDDWAWRCGTILAVRQVLPVSHQHAWMLSGERRQNYPILHINKRDLEKVFFDFSVDQTRLVWSLLKLAKPLMHLISLDQTEVNITRIKPLRGAKQAQELIDAVGAISELSECMCWIGEVGEIETPGFAEVLPSNDWSLLVAHLVQRFGMTAWKWRLSYLQSRIEQLLPGKRYSPIQGEQAPGQKWLRTLSSEQKSAFHDLQHLITKIGDDLGYQALSIFCVRLALLVLPDHYRALVSLQKMRAPFFLVRGLEGFILSEPYSEYRHGKGIVSKVPVPKSIHEAPYV